MATKKKRVVSYLNPATEKKLTELVDSTGLSASAVIMTAIQLLHQQNQQGT